MASVKATHVVGDNSNDFVGLHDNSNGADDGRDQVDTLDDDGGTPQDNVDLDNLHQPVDMDIDEEDIPPPPPSRWAADPVAAESAPQSALAILTARDTPGKRHKIILGNET